MREICVSPFCTAFAINGINLQYVLPRLTQDLPSFECCFAQEIIMVLKDCDIFASVAGYGLARESHNLLQMNLLCSVQNPNNEKRGSTR